MGKRSGGIIEDSIRRPPHPSRIPMPSWQGRSRPIETIGCQFSAWQGTAESESESAPPRPPTGCACARGPSSIIASCARCYGPVCGHCRRDCGFCDNTFCQQCDFRHFCSIEQHLLALQRLTNAAFSLQGQGQEKGKGKGKDKGKKK
jgi:hypothetical protein